jgi:hypothetical protein
VCLDDCIASQCLDLSFNGLGNDLGMVSAAFKLLTTVLSMNTSITHLNLSNNDISAKEGAILAKSLLSNSTLRYGCCRFALPRAVSVSAALHYVLRARGYRFGCGACRGLHLSGNAVMVDSMGFIVPRYQDSNAITNTRVPLSALSEDLALAGKALRLWAVGADAVSSSLRPPSPVAGADDAGDAAAGGGGGSAQAPSAVSAADADAVQAHTENRIVCTWM